MPRTEPNALPPLFSSWQEWRAAYDAYVDEFDFEGDEDRLKENLIRLGYSGAILTEELKYIKDIECTLLS